MQCHANKFQTVSNLLVQVLCLHAVCLDSNASKPLIKQHIAAYLQKYLRDFGCHSSILMPCKLALGRAKSWTKGTSVVSCQHYLGLYLLCLPHQCNRLPSPIWTLNRENSMQYHAIQLHIQIYSEFRPLSTTQPFSSCCCWRSLWHLPGSWWWHGHH